MKRLLAVVLALALCLGLFVTAASAREACYGDVDGNGNINASDALRVLKHAVGKTRLNGEQQTLADVNADDAINASDALMILKRAVGKLSIFPVEDSFIGRIAIEKFPVSLLKNGTAVVMVRAEANQSVSIRCQAGNPDVSVHWAHDWTEYDPDVLPLIITSHTAVDQDVSITLFFEGHEYIAASFTVSLSSGKGPAPYKCGHGLGVMDFGVFAGAAPLSSTAYHYEDNVYHYYYSYLSSDVAASNAAAFRVLDRYRDWLTSAGFDLTETKANAYGGTDYWYEDSLHTVIVGDMNSSGDARIFAISVFYYPPQ